MKTQRSVCKVEINL